MAKPPAVRLVHQPKIGHAWHEQMHIDDVLKARPLCTKKPWDQTSSRSVPFRDAALGQQRTLDVVHRGINTSFVVLDCKPGAHTANAYDWSNNGRPLHADFNSCGCRVGDSGGLRYALRAGRRTTVPLA